MKIVTSALIYANGPIHLGHIKSTYLPADIYVRYLRQKGEEVLFICATDDHGTPIALEADRQKTSPLELIKYYHYKDEKEFADLGIVFDIFHWTSSQENKETTIEFYKDLKPYIYTKNVIQYYCKEIDRYMPDRYVKGKCKYCGAEDQYADQCEICGRTLNPGDLIDPYCILTKTKPELKESKHLFFKLSEFKDFLKEWNSNSPKEIKAYLDQWIENLNDWDIVRDLNWGIPVPDLPGKVFYVWFDAPIGYIGSLRALRKDWKQLWNNSQIIHFIGKDIIYHHYLFWPAMLKGANFNLPYRIPVRGYLTLEGKKFSKSRGWYLSLEQALKYIHPDYLRYYLTIITPSGLVDSDFSLDGLKSTINNDLIANYGNLVYRAMKLWKGENLKSEMDEYEKQILNKYITYMDNIDLKEGLETLGELTKYYNRILSEKEPWKMKDPIPIISKIVYGSVFLTKLLTPFIPFSTTKLLKYYNQEINLKYPEYIPYKEPIMLFKKIENETEELRAILYKASR